MIVARLKRQKVYYLKPLCKECHNARERGHRREYKTKYLRAWRARNVKLTESYWREDPDRKAKTRINAARHFQNNHTPILIQGRLRRKGIRVSLKEAEELFKKFGRCYPTRAGLTAKGLRECERIRSTLRRGERKLRLRPIDIRIMVYEDGLFIKPSRQPFPFQKSAEKLREWQAQRRVATAEAGA
jgi:hypothetical protein